MNKIESESSENSNPFLLGHLGEHHYCSVGKNFEKVLVIRLTNTEDGPIMTTMRHGKAKTDAYFARSRTLLQGAKNLHTITGAHVKLEIIPTWVGKAHSWKYQAFPENAPQHAAPQQHADPPPAAPHPAPTPSLQKRVVDSQTQPSRGSKNK